VKKGNNASQNISSPLVGGRLIADNGRSFDFLSGGTARTSYDLFSWNNRGEKTDSLYWSSNDGYLTLRRMI